MIIQAIKKLKHKKILNNNKDGFNDMDCVRQKLMNDGLSKESIDIIMSSWGTLPQKSTILT